MSKVHKVEIMSKVIFTMREPLEESALSEVLLKLEQHLNSMRPIQVECNVRPPLARFHFDMSTINSLSQSDNFQSTTPEFDMLNVFKMFRV